MKKVFRIVGMIVAGVVFLIVCAATFVSVRGIPSYDPPKVAITPIEANPARMAQGEKIVRALCADCHLDTKTMAMTGKFLDELPPEFGKLYSANITQDKEHGIGAWSDAEIVGLLRTGIGRDGRFRIVMPNFVHMSDEDVASVVTFLRSADPIVAANPTPSHAQEPSFLAKALVNTVMKPTPVPTSPVMAPPVTDAVAYGKYLVHGRYKCYDCHSADFKTNNALEPEKSEGYLAGGTSMVTKGGAMVVSRNLTPDPETGLGDWDAPEFVKAVRFGLSPNGPLRYPMPKYSLMSEEEAQAIFAYLRSVPPVKHATPEDGGGGVASN